MDHGRRPYGTSAKSAADRAATLRMNEAAQVVFRRRTNANLSAELVPVELTHSQMTPKRAFRVGHVLTKKSRPLVPHRAAAPPIPTFPQKGEAAVHYE